MRFSLAVFHVAAETKASDKGKHHVRDSKSKDTGALQSASHPITIPAATHTEHMVALDAFTWTPESLLSLSQPLVPSLLQGKQTHRKHTNTQIDAYVPTHV